MCYKLLQYLASKDQPTARVLLLPLQLLLAAQLRAGSLM